MSTWHPILNAIEDSPGVWILTAQTGPYAIVRLLEIGGQLGYRATTYTEPRELIGYFTNLRAACSAAHRHYLRTHGPQMNAANLYPDLRGPHENMSHV